MLRDYRETIDPTSPLVRLLEPRADPQPYFVQFGWTAGEAQKPAPRMALPGDDTVWTADGTLTATTPVTLSWDNGQGLVFEIALAIDDHYMFSVQQRVRNSGTAPVVLYPWSRIRRDYTPVTAGYYILHEGLLGVLDGRLKEVKYAAAKSDGEKTGGLALTTTAPGGWAGFTDKYWLTALIPDQASQQVASFRHSPCPGRRLPGRLRRQGPRDHRPRRHRHRRLAPVRRRQGGPPARPLRERGRHPELRQGGRLRLVLLPHQAVLLRHRLAELASAATSASRSSSSPSASRLLFFPLANKSYRSMSKMKLLGPKMTALRERYKDEPAKLQSEMMGLYKTEKVNPASGCLPMVIQIPVFFSLYKVIFVTIEMRQAPFFGWIHDLSAVDPTNVFNLFGLLPFNPVTILAASCISAPGR